MQRIAASAIANLNRYSRHMTTPGDTKVSRNEKPWLDFLSQRIMRIGNNTGVIVSSNDGSVSGEATTGVISPLHSLTRSRLPSSRRHRYTINGVISPVLGLVVKVTVPGLSRR